MKTVTIRDFSGGLDTATDPSRLPANKSASMSNVEILDSKAIRRRKGYQAITSTPLRDGRLESVNRVYLGSNSYWFSRCGTAAFSAPDNVTTSYGLVQVESLAASPSLMYDGTQFSGGSAIRLTSSTDIYAFSVPYSSRAVAKIGGDGISVAVDSTASWVNSTGDSATLYSGLTASTHTVYVKAYQTRAQKSLKLAPSGLNKFRQRQRTLDISDTPADGYNKKHFSFYFYDDGVAGKDVYVQIAHAGYSSYWGLYSPQSTTHYSVFNRFIGWMTTDVPRSVGWHRVDFWALKSPTTGEYNVMILPLVDSPDTSRAIGSSYGTSSSVSLLCHVRSRTSGSATAYFDELRTQLGIPWTQLPDSPTMLDDLDALTGWTGSGDATDNDAIATNIYRADAESFIDTIEYQHSATQSRVTPLSASTSDLACATLNGRVYFGDAYTALKEWNGTAATSVTSSGTAPAARFLVSHKRRLFAAGKASDKSLLEYTNVDSGRDWSGGGALRVTGKDSGGDCTGLAVWSDVLWYFGYSRIHAIDCTGPDSNWVNKTVNDRYGCISPRSLALAPNAMIFLSEGGVRAYGQVPGINNDDGSGLLWLSESIQPTLDSINREHLDKVCGAFYRNKYYLSVPLGGATENNATFVFRFAEGDTPASWTRYDYGADCFHTPRGDEEGLYGGGHATARTSIVSSGGSGVAVPVYAPNSWATWQTVTLDRPASDLTFTTNISVAASSPRVYVSSAWIRPVGSGGLPTSGYVYRTAFDSLSGQFTEPGEEGTYSISMPTALDAGQYAFHIVISCQAGGATLGGITMKRRTDGSLYSGGKGGYRLTSQEFVAGDGSDADIDWDFSLSYVATDIPDGNIYRFEHGTSDAGEPISMYYKTPPLAPDGYQTVKHFRRAHFGIEANAPQTLLVTPYTDDVDGEPVVLNISDSTDVAPVRTPMNARGRSLGLIFEGQGGDQDVTISEVTLTYVEPRMR